MKCPECEFVYGTKWELNRHLKSKHNLKVVEGPLEVKALCAAGGLALFVMDNVSDEAFIACMQMQVETQYVSVEGEEHLTEAPVAVLEQNGNIFITQQTDPC